MPGWARWAVVFHLVVLAWVLFRAPDLGVAGAMYHRLLVPGPATLFTPAILLAITVAIGLQLVPERPLVVLRHRLEAMNPGGLAMGLAVTIAIVGATVPGGAVPPFIYFQF